MGKRATQSSSARVNAVPWERLLLLVAVFTGFSFLVFFPYLHGHWKLADDAYQFTLPMWRYQERVIRLGEWPFWGTNSGFGKPVDLNAGGSLYFLPQLIWGQLIGWSEISYIYFLFFVSIFSGLSAFRFSKVVGLTTEASFFFAYAFISNGFVLGMLSNPSLTIPFLFWPLLLTGLYELHESAKNPVRSMQTIALGLVLIETSGYPQTKLLIYLFTALGYWALVRKPGTWFGNLKWKLLTIASTVALLITCPEWLTALQTMGLADRLHQDIYGEYTYGAPTNFLAWASMLVPTAFLKRESFQIAVTPLERSWWVGSLTIVFALLGFTKNALPFKKTAPLFILALLGFLFSMGGHSFFREIAAMGLPIFEHLRFANMARMLPMAFFIFAGAACFSQFQQSNQKRSAPDPTRSKYVTRAWIAFLIICTVVGLNEVDLSVRASDLYLDPMVGWKVGALHTLFYLLLAYSAFELRWEFSKWKWPAILVMIQVLSLTDASYAFRRLVAEETRDGLKGSEPFKMASPQPNERSIRKWLDGNDWITWDGNKKVINAYDIPAHYLLNTALTDPKTASLASTLVSCQDNASQLSLAGAAAAVPLSCAGMGIQIDRYFGNVIEISGAGSASAYIVAHDLYDPNWHGFLNGAEVPIVKAYGYFKAIQVPPSKWKIRFQYVNPGFPALWILSALGIIILCGLSKLIPRKNILN